MRYRLFIEKHQVTLVDQETGKRESYGITGGADLRVLEAVNECRRQRFNVQMIFEE